MKVQEIGIPLYLPFFEFMWFSNLSERDISVSTKETSRFADDFLLTDFEEPICCQGAILNSKSRTSD